jgi:hypothetical protein
MMLDTSRLADTLRGVQTEATMITKHLRPKIAGLILDCRDF